mmetsp:Transcript_30152/g.36598  ORF Transcript_30152/g.36598 Transcript_30152/m.36598 type:complete len:232 (-) Transcript_30152:80-775(-)
MFSSLISGFRCFKSMSDMLRGPESSSLKSSSSPPAPPAPFAPQQQQQPSPPGGGIPAPSFPFFSSSAHQSFHLSVSRGPRNSRIFDVTPYHDPTYPAFRIVAEFPARATAFAADGRTLGSLSFDTGCGQQTCEVFTHGQCVAKVSAGCFTSPTVRLLNTMQTNMKINGYASHWSCTLDDGMGRVFACHHDGGRMAVTIEPGHDPIMMTLVAIACQQLAPDTGIICCIPLCF